MRSGRRYTESLRETGASTRTTSARRRRPGTGSERRRLPTETGSQFRPSRSGMRTGANTWRSSDYRRNAPPREIEVSS
jgi:hypothetical protein